MSIPKIVSISVKDPVVPLYEFVDTLDAHGARGVYSIPTGPGLEKSLRNC